MSDRFIAPGATLGVMGGGQLGRMLVHAAQQMGYATAVLDRRCDEPGRASSPTITCAAATSDPTGPRRARRGTAPRVTTEFENVPAAALRTLALRAPRGARTPTPVAICQDRAAEKAHFDRMRRARARRMP
jgi:5-(carboxyamino)imidazole ribonucleotide synthase